MDTDFFPEFIRACPAPDSPFAMRAHIVPSEHVLPMFYEIDEDVHIPEHAHGPQWGVVLDGIMEFTIDGTSRQYTRGDTYYVPDGVPHTAYIHAGYKGIDVFSDPLRYRPVAP